jgi:hypothetical protein
VNEEELRAWRAAIRAAERERAALLLGGQEDLVRLLRGLYDAIAARLAEQPADWQRTQLAQLQAQLTAVIQGITGQLQQAVDDTVVAGWNMGAEHVDDVVRAVRPGMAPGFMLADTFLLDALRSFSAGRIKDLSTTAEGVVQTQVHLAAVGAQTNQQAIAEIRKHLVGEAAPARARARRIVITSTQQSYSIGQQKRMEEEAARQPGLRKRWKKSGKPPGRSRHNHDDIDGQTVGVFEKFRVPGKGLGEFTLMLHPHDPKAPPGQVINCGCLMQPFYELDDLDAQFPLV